MRRRNERARDRTRIRGMSLDERSMRLAAFSVVVSFDPELWARASKDRGWYAIWWPAGLNAIAVASSDTRSLVIDSFPP